MWLLIHDANDAHALIPLSYVHMYIQILQTGVKTQIHFSNNDALSVVLTNIKHKCVQAMLQCVL